MEKKKSYSWVMWNHFRNMVDVDRLANICRNYLATPPIIPFLSLAYVWILFLLIWSGWQREFSKMEKPSVWDTIPELYEMSPKINYFDLAFKVSCFLHREMQHASTTIVFNKDWEGWVSPVDFFYQLKAFSKKLFLIFIKKSYVVEK